MTLTSNIDATALEGGHALRMQDCDAALKLIGQPPQAHTPAMRVAVLRCQNLPSFVTWDIPDVDALFADDHLLIAAFADRGAAAEAHVRARVR